MQQNRDTPPPPGPPIHPADTLDAALVSAHEQGDLTALVAHYAAAGARALAAGDVDAGCFFLTHARVFALEAGDAREAALRATLKGFGREE